MSKEYLEALKIVKYNSSKEVVEAFDIIENGLKRLESIDNAKPSEAIKFLEELEQNIESRVILDEYRQLKLCAVIKQALIKAQEQEKENARNEEILQKYYQEGITLDSVRALKQERDNYKKVLSIIKEKDVDVFRFKKLDFYTFNQLQKSCRLLELTKEEFDLLKRWLG